MRPAFAAVLWGLGLATIGLASANALAQVVLESRNLRLEIGADGTLKGLAARASAAEYAWLERPAPVARVYRGGQTAVASQEAFGEDQAPVYRGGQSFPATSAALAGDRLTLRFAGAGVTAVYHVTRRPDYLAFRLVELQGDPIDRIDLVRLAVKRLPHLAPWIDAAYDDRFGVCLCAGNIRTNAGLEQHGQHVELTAVAEKAVALEGTTAVLFGFEGTRESFLDAMEVVERDFQMPPGARNRRSPVQDYSYLWCHPTPENIGEYVKLAQRAGLRAVLFSYTSFSKGAGHFVWNDRYPGGMADLKKVADAIRAAGLKAGLHIHYSKAARTDPYVTPVPNERFHKLRTFTLSADVDAQSPVLPVQEDPAGATRDEGRRVLKIGKELVSYTDYTRGPPYRFTGCERGHLKTAAAAHQAGDRADLLDVDDWVLFIRFDQATDIQDETARRIAAIVRETGPYDILYFDGAEDVHDPFWRHVAGAQDRVYRLLDPAPAVCEAAMSSHFSWHIVSRGNAYDVPGDRIKSFTHRVPCRTAPVRAAECTRVNFGWVFDFYKDMGPDDLEYLLSRGAAWDCPFSIRVPDLTKVAANPRAEDCLDVIKTWEDARIGRKLTPGQKQMLRTVDPKDHEFIKTWHAVLLDSRVKTWKDQPFADQEHHLFVNEKGEYELVPIKPLAPMAGGKVKAYAFQREGRPGDTYVLLWATGPDVELRLALAPEQVTLMRRFGKPLSLKAESGRTVVPVGSRRYLCLRGVSPNGAQDAIGRSTKE